MAGVSFATLFWAFWVAVMAPTEALGSPMKKKAETLRRTEPYLSRRQVAGPITISRRDNPEYERMYFQCPTEYYLLNVQQTDQYAFHLFILCSKEVNLSFPGSSVTESRLASLFNDAVMKQVKFIYALSVEIATTSPMDNIAGRIENAYKLSGYDIDKYVIELQRDATQSSFRIEQTMKIVQKEEIAYRIITEQLSTLQSRINAVLVDVENRCLLLPDINASDLVVARFFVCSRFSKWQKIGSQFIAKMKNELLPMLGLTVTGVAGTSRRNTEQITPDRLNKALEEMKALTLQFVFQYRVLNAELATLRRMFFGNSEDTPERRAFSNVILAERFKRRPRRMTAAHWFWEFLVSHFVNQNLNEANSNDIEIRFAELRFAFLGHFVAFDHLFIDSLISPNHVLLSLQNYVEEVKIRHETSHLCFSSYPHGKSLQNCLRDLCEMNKRFVYAVGIAVVMK